MKFVFQTMPAYGHLNPMLGVAQELINRGHKVTVYNVSEFKDKIESVGAEFKKLPLGTDTIDLRILHNAVNIAELSLQGTELLVDPLIKEIEEEKPDCLIHDSLSLWGKVVGLHTKIPTVALVPSMAINLKVILNQTSFLINDYKYIASHPLIFLNIMRRFRNVYMRKGLIPPFTTDIFSNSEKLNIVFTSRYFQPLEKSFNESYKFVGPIVYDRQEKQLNVITENNKPIIYVALGTIYNDKVDTYRSIIQALKVVSYPSYISIGKYINISDLGDIPPNVYIASYLPQLEMLGKSSLFISHCGMNSVNESLYFGVPLLMIPIIQEQRINAKRVEELGAGIYHKKQPIDIPQFVESINSLLQDKKYKHAADLASTALSSCGGAKEAANHILNFIS